MKKFKVADLSSEDTWELDSATHGRVKAVTFVGENLAVGTYNNGMLFGKFGDQPEQIIYVSFLFLALCFKVGPACDHEEIG